MYPYRTAQAQSYQEKLQDDLYEMSKPLARYADDEDLERMLKARERAGDPMLAFLKKPSSKTNSNRKPKKGTQYNTQLKTIHLIFDSCREADIQGGFPSKSLRHQAWVQMGWCE